MSRNGGTADGAPFSEGAPAAVPSEEDLEALRAYEEALGAEVDAEVATDGDAAAGSGLGRSSAEVQLATERDEYLDALRRLQAEFENYRKRTARQQSELLERATEGLLERLLPVLDALDLAVAHAERSELAPDEVAAFGRIASLLRDTLAKDGLERIDETGSGFDPTVHDAVAHVPAEERVDGEETSSQGATVVEVLRPGYRLKGRVLRPAMVKVQG